MIPQSRTAPAPSVPVIRFKCPNCRRLYEVPAVMTRLPLLCKGCGQRLDVPESSTEPEAVVVESVALATAPGTGQHALPKPSLIASSEGGPCEVGPTGPEPLQQPAKQIVLNNNGPGTTRAETEPAAAPNPEAGAPDNEDRQYSLSWLSRIVDVLVGAMLLAIGVFLGEFLAGQPTGEVLRLASTAVKFPTIELLLWMAPPAALGLLYWLLVSRRNGLGDRLQRKRRLRRAG